jgi:uncharacterized protein YlbG (UPF0298 family)
MYYNVVFPPFPDITCFGGSEVDKIAQELQGTSFFKKNRKGHFDFLKKNQNEIPNVDNDEI